MPPSVPSSSTMLHCSSYSDLPLLMKFNLYSRLYSGPKAGKGTVVRSGQLSESDFIGFRPRVCFGLETIQTCGDFIRLYMCESSRKKSDGNLGYHSRERYQSCKSVKCDLGRVLIAHAGICEVVLVKGDPVSLPTVALLGLNPKGNKIIL